MPPLDDTQPPENPFAQWAKPAAEPVENPFAQWAKPQYSTEKPFVPPKGATQEQADSFFGLPPGTPVKTPKGLMLVPKPKAEDQGVDPTTGAEVDYSGYETPPQPPGWLGTAYEAGKKGIVHGFTEASQAPTAFAERKPEEPDTSPTGQLLSAPISQGWADPKWWIAHIVHGAAASSPSLATGMAGAAAGAAMAGPVGGLVGGAGGFGVGAAIQTIAPAYQRARQDGLSHDDAVTRALEQSGIAAGFGAAMGAAPVLAPLKGAVSNALLQIFGAQPALGLGQLAATQATEGKIPTLDELGTAYAENAGMGAAMVGPHAGARRIIGRGTPEQPGQQPPVAPGPEGAPPAGLPPVSSVFDVPMGGDTPSRMTVTGYTPEGFVEMTDSDGVVHEMTPDRLGKIGTPVGPEEVTRTEVAPESEAQVVPSPPVEQPPEATPAPPPPADPQQRSAPRTAEDLEREDAEMRAALQTGQPAAPDALPGQLAAVEAEVAPDATAVPRGTATGEPDAENPFPSASLKELREFAQRPGASQAVHDEIARREAAGRPRQSPPPVPQANSASELPAAMGAMGRGMTESLYNDIYAGLGGADNTVARMERNLMARLRPFFDAGYFKSPEDIRALVQANYDPRLAGLTPAAPEGGVPATPQGAQAPREPETQAPPLAPYTEHNIRTGTGEVRPPVPGVRGPAFERPPVVGEDSVFDAGARAGEPPSVGRSRSPEITDPINRSLYTGFMDVLEGRPNILSNDPMVARLKPFYDQGYIREPADIQALVNANFDPTRAGLEGAAGKVIEGEQPSVEMPTASELSDQWAGEPRQRGERPGPQPGDDTNIQTIRPAETAPDLPEHPGLVVQSLETGKKELIQPPGTRAPRLTPQIEPLPGSEPLGVRPPEEALRTEPPAPTSSEGTREADNGLQNPVPVGDAGPGAEDARGSAPARPDRPAPAAEEPGGQRDVAGPPEEAPPPEPRAGEAGGGDRAPDADRVPAGEAGPGDGGAAGRSAPDAAVKGENHVIEPGAVAESRSPRTKARDNLSAIELAKRITDEGRAATKEEQAALAKYVGWGGLSGAFPHPETGKYRPEFEAVGQRLKDILTPSEYRTAVRSTQYAHYTSEPVIRAMWDAVKRMGFKGGSVFEPGMGVGHFLGMMPPDLAAASKYQGLELDHVTAQIAKLLYPQSGVRQADLTRTPMPHDAFDLAIGNPPFGDIAITSDPKYAARGFLLHDYFFAKSLDSVRPGGLLGFVTSAGTMNKMDSTARRFMAERAEFVGGVRLNSGAFAKSAGTEVTTDILFFKKRPSKIDVGETVPEWADTVFRTLPNAKGVPTEGIVSRYFSEHPEMVLGEEGFFDKLYKDRYAVHPRPGDDMPTLLNEALARLPENIMDPPLSPEQKASLDFSTTEKKEGSYYVAPDGRLMQYSSGAGQPVQRRGAGVEGGKTAAEIEAIRALLPIRDALRDVFRHDLSGDTEAATKARATLNRTYDNFVKANGPLSKTDISYRQPTVVQQETARTEAREEAREMGFAWDEGTFDPSAMIARGAKAAEIARARREAKEAAQRNGEDWDEGTFDPSDMPPTPIVKRPNLDAFADDQESFRLLALENYDSETGDATKRRIFRESTLTREEDPKLNSPHDGILWSVNKFGKLDIDEIAQKLGQPRDKVIAQLGDAVMRVPGTEEVYQPRDAYLSGDVVTKLDEARAAAEKDPRFQANVAALEEAQPRPLSPAEIQVNIGMPWIPPEVMHQFIADLGIGGTTIEYSPLLGRHIVDTRYAQYGPNRAQWSTEDVSAHQILSDVMNRKPTVVKRVEYVDGKKTDSTDPVATQAAQDKANLMKQAFQDWVAADPERADGLAQIYNGKYNRVVLRNWNGDYLTTPGISTDWSWRPHQTRVVARIIQDGNTYMAHAVGAGKTSAMIGAGMEMRRLGLVSKTMYVVPNHMLGQFAKEFYEQYPTARIRVADDRNFHTSKRKQFVADVAQQDLDAVIITNSAFKKVPVSREFGDRLIQEQVDEIDDAIAQLEGTDSRITVKDLQKRKERLEQRLQGAGGEQDAVNTFEEMGVDFLFVDEAHQFRKLSFVTQTPMKGITSQGSDMAWDLYTKARYLDENRPGRSLVMASGTPVTNTMGELYTLSRFMQPGALKDRGISHFDSWAQSFGDTKTDIEQTAQGTYEPVTRFAKFVNIPELYKMVGANMDVVTENELGQYVTRPQLAGGERQFHLAPRTPWLEAFQRGLADRVAAIKERRGPPSKGDDILLAVINDGRMSALDPRLVDPRLPSDPDSKLNQMIDNVHRIWDETKDTQFYDPNSDYKTKAFRGPAAQMVFANFGIAGGAGGNQGGKFSAYQWMKRELQRRGIPADEIAFIKDATTPVAKQRLFNDVNEGKVRILIGSTQKMGTGVNAQRRLVAIHNLDPLWFPADDTQRNGRGIRQGNYNPEIQIHDYSTKGTYDATMWGMMGRKGRFIEQFFRGDPALRDMEDLGEAGQYEQASAMSTADPRVIQLTEMKQELQKLERRQQAHENEQYSYRIRGQQESDKVAYYQRQAEAAAGAIAKAQDITGDKFSMEVAGKRYTDRKAAGTAVEKAAAEMVQSLPAGQEVPFGSIGGYPITLRAIKSDRVLADGTRERVFPALNLQLWNPGGEAPLSFNSSGAGLIQSAAGKIRDMAAQRDAYIQQQRGAETRGASNRREIGKEFADRDKIQPLRQQVAALEAELSRKPDEAAAETEAPQDELARLRQEQMRMIDAGEDKASSKVGDFAPDYMKVMERIEALSKDLGVGRYAQDDPAPGTMGRLLRDESGAGLNPFRRGDPANPAEAVEQEAVAAVPRGTTWSEKASRILGVSPRSPGYTHYNFNAINKNFTTPRAKAAVDPRSAVKWEAELAKYRDAAELVHDYREGLASWQGKPVEQWRKLFSAMELLTLEGRDVPLDGREVIVTNRNQPYAALSKVGDRVALLTPDEIQMFTDYRKTMDNVWQNLVAETAKQFGWEGEPNAAAIRKAAEATTDAREGRRLMRAAKLVAAIEYQHRTAYLPLMRSGDYFLRVKPNRPNEDWNGEGYAPTTMFKLIDSQSWLEQARGGKRGGTPGQAQDAIAELRKTFPEGDYDIDHGYMFRSTDAIRDLDIPAIDKLMMLVGSDARNQLSERMRDTGMDRHEATKAAQAYYDKLVDTVLDQIYEQRVAGFKRQRKGIPGYDDDFAKSTGRYLGWLANYTAGMRHRADIEAADQAMETHPDKRTRDFWRDWDRRQEDYGDQLHGPLAKARQGAFLWYLGANAATSAKIMLHGPLRGVPVLTTGLGGVGKTRAIGDYLNASRQLLGALTADKDKGIVVDFDRVAGKLSSPERALLADSERKGILHPQTADEIAAVKTQGEEALTDRGRFTKKVFDIWSSNVSAADRMVRGSMLLSGYRTANRMGMDAINRVWDKDLNWKNQKTKTPESFAQFLVDETVGIWGDINRMPMLRSQLGGMVGQFKTYEIGYMSNLNKMLWHMGPEGKVTAALMMGGLGMMGGLFAVPMAEDALSAVNWAYHLVDSVAPDLETSLKHAFDALVGEGAGSAVLHGPRAGGIDWSGLGFGDMLSKSSQTGIDLFGAAPSAVGGSLYRSLQRYRSGQGELAAARELLPNAAKHMLDALYPEISLTSTSGKSKALPDSAITDADRVKMGLGFQPAVKAEHFERQSAGMRQIATYKAALGLAEDRIANLMARGQPTTDAIAAAMQVVARGQQDGVFSAQEAAIVRRDLHRKIAQRLHPEVPSKTMQRIETMQRVQ